MIIITKVQSFLKIICTDVSHDKFYMNISQLTTQYYRINTLVSYGFFLKNNAILKIALCIKMLPAKETLLSYIVYPQRSITVACEKHKEETV
jgi:hypothetical protein